MLRQMFRKKLNILIIEIPVLRGHLINFCIKKDVKCHKIFRKKIKKC